MKQPLGLLLYLVIFLAAGIFTIQKAPSLFSYQDRVDPNNLKEEYDANAKVAIFNNQSVDIPTVSPDTEALVLGDNTTEKRIEVDLTNQKLYAYEGTDKVYDFPISSGLWDRTHPGTYKIWAKIRSQKMSGGSKELGTYYYLPNVPWIMFFYNDQHPKYMGYSIHGAYWHNKFGQPMSHGCVNMKPIEAKVIFEWATMDTPITIYGKYLYPVSTKINKSKT